MNEPKLFSFYSKIYYSINDSKSKFTYFTFMFVHDNVAIPAARVKKNISIAQRKSSKLIQTIVI